MRTVNSWQRRNMANREHVAWKEQGDLCTADMGRNRENSVVQVAGKEQRELCVTGGREGTGRTLWYRWQGRNRENCVQVAGK
jgi:hypothetical protein